MSPPHQHHFRFRFGVLSLGAIAYLLVAVIASCKGDEGDTGAAGTDGKDAPVPIMRSDPLPGFNLVISSIFGGTGPNGNFMPGDTMKITFSATEDDGDPIPPAAWAFDEVMLAGPVGNVQRLLRESDVVGNSVMNADGSYTFTFPSPIPATVPQQINEAISTIPWQTGATSGQPVPDGTYWVAMGLRQNVEIEGRTFRDVANVTMPVLMGAAAAVTNLELVTDANCNNCHTEVRFHGQNRRGVVYCQTCHTNGSVAGDNPAESISFATMLHKIHSGRHLPSVNGKTVDNAGNPVFGAGVPYVISGTDYSHVGFPQWPHLDQGMPQDLGYDGLPSDDQRDVEDAILAGPTNCAACHGDPGGGNPPPADGDLIFSSEIVTRACIGCHDDWDPAKPYRANEQTMPAGLLDGSCTVCHGENPTNPNSAVNVRKAHTHPLLDTNNPPLWGPTAGAIDLTFNVTAVTELTGAGNSDGDGTIEPGEKMEVTVDIVDGDGNAVDTNDLSRIEISVAGPMQNPNTIYTTSFGFGLAPALLLPGPGPSHTFTPPERVHREIAVLGGSPTEFVTARTPHYPAPALGAANDTLVWTVSTGIGGGTTTLAEVPPFQNHIDVADGTGLAAGDIVVIDDTNLAKAEYLSLRAVETIGAGPSARLWFSAPIDVVVTLPRKHHDVGASVIEVTPAAVVPTNVDAATGTITLPADPAPDRVLVSYTTDFVFPTHYPGAINNSPSVDPTAPDLDAAIGEWTGFAIENGTYFFGVYGEVGFDVTVPGTVPQITSYTEGSQGNTITTFGLSVQPPLDTYDRITIGSCVTCHRDIQFHGSHRRGIQNCVLCHGVSGAEDWGRFRSTPPLGTLETPGVTIDFREMLHKIHRGRDLADAENYIVNGFRGRPIKFDEIGFPSFVGGTANCDSCHGAGNTAWYAPTDRLHPSQTFTAPQKNWNLVCSACHDDRPSLAHIQSNTSASGLESCAICHGDDEPLSVRIVHENLIR